MKIESQIFNIHHETKIADDVEIIASDLVEIGRYAVIGSGFKVRCRSLKIGRHCYIGERVGIGGGGSMGPNAHVLIGEQSLIADGCFINCAETVTIGRHVAFGYETQIWTHGIWQPVIEGFSPMKQAPVNIGDEVWLPSRCQVLAGVTIGDYTVVGMGSLVNKDLPTGCVAVGRPARIIKKNVYPEYINNEVLKPELERLIEIYQGIANDKGFNPHVYITEDCELIFSYLDEQVVFRPRTRQFSPTTLSDYAEDFRDFLRRWGFPFYGGGFFRSIVPRRFSEMRLWEVP